MNQMGFKPCGISKQTTRFASRRGRKDPYAIEKRNHYFSIPSPSPTAAPFNSTSFLIRQKSHQREEEAPRVTCTCRPRCGLEQYGSNQENMIACCSFAMDHHDPDCSHRDSQAHQHRPVIVGMSAKNHSWDDDSQLHFQLERLRITDCPVDERMKTQSSDSYQRHHHCSDPSDPSDSSDPRVTETMELDDLNFSAAREQGDYASKHRRVRSVVDDNFDLFPSNGSAMKCDSVEDDIGISCSI